MKMSLGVLADYANVTREGKLNIMGIFGVLWAKKFPAAHPQMQLVIEFEADRAEAGRMREMEIQLRSEDGPQVLPPLKGKMQMGAVPPGELSRMHQILVLNNVRFEAQGQYQFVVMVDNEVKGQIPLKVVHLASESPVTQ